MEKDAKEQVKRQATAASAAANTPQTADHTSTETAVFPQTTSSASDGDDPELVGILSSVEAQVFHQPAAEPVTI